MSSFHRAFAIVSIGLGVVGQAQAQEDFGTSLDDLLDTKISTAAMHD